jgi:hypothetical protein
MHTDFRRRGFHEEDLQEDKQVIYLCVFSYRKAVSAALGYVASNDVWEWQTQASDCGGIRTNSFPVRLLC